MQPDGTTPVMANISRNGAWWMPILEKAYAKYSAFYANMNGGTPIQSFRDLTGMPIIRYDSRGQTTEKLFEIIEEADKKDWVLTAACDVAIQGLQNGHAYTILGYARLTDPEDGTDWDLLKMRNPWGNEGYTGAWSDKDSRWNAKNKSAVDHVDANDGIFYLPVETFRQAMHKYFEGMYQDWHVKRWSVSSTDGQAFAFKKHINSPIAQEAYLTIDWMPERRYPAVNCGTFRRPHQYNFFITDTTTNTRV